jgi:hypothetical protein
MMYRITDLRDLRRLVARVTTLSILGIFGVVLVAVCLWAFAFPRAASAATDGGFQITANPGGGSILTGILGNESLPAATAALMRRVHAELGVRPAVVQTVENRHDHSLALLFTAARNDTSYTGVAIVTATPGAQAAGTALYDITTRFHTTVGPMLTRLQSMTARANASNAPSAAVKLAPPEPLSEHAFPDGTGSISVPTDWTVSVAGGGSALVSGPAGSAQVSYNMHFGGLDPSNPRAQTFMRTASPLARQNFHGAVLPYTGDPVKSWTAMYEALARQRGMNQPQIHIVSSTPAGSTAANIAGTLGSGPKAIHFIAYVFVLPPNPMGMWQLSDSHIFVTDKDLARQAETANAVLDSVRINFGAVAAQQAAIRQMFQKQFESEIANDRAQDAARAARTDEALANDRAAQEGMHKEAVAMENYSLDRAVVVNTANGRHSTLDAGFADTLVRDNPNYQKVPAASLLRGVDY